MLSNFHKRIVEKANDVHAAPVLVIPFGDSVTQGCMEIDVLDHACVYHQVLKQMLEVNYPNTTFSILNAGCSGETAADGLKRLERDVLRHDPDLVLLGFALNDACAGADELDKYLCSIRTIVNEIRKSVSCDIIIITPNFMAARKTPLIADQHQECADKIIQCQNDGTLKLYVEHLRELAIELQVPLADVYGEWEQMSSEDVDTTLLLINGLNHPDKSGHKLIADNVFNLICKFEEQ